ncbi:hypothetical protein [Flavobacterium sp.]
MSKSKIYKILGVLVLVTIIGGGIWYWQLPNRHKAIVKSFVFEKTGIVNPNWKVQNQSETYRMISPEFYIDGIYKSMEGPKSSKYVKLSRDSSLVWLTGFHVKALDSKSMQYISNDYICHTNVDFNDVNYYTSLHLQKRIGSQYPRMTSLSHGMESFNFPAGYGVPMKGNEYLYVTTQSLNHNLPDADQWIRHEVDIDYSQAKNLKPLMSRTAFIMLPFDKSNPYKSPLDPGTDQCIPVETKNHTYDDGKGNKLSGHWVIPAGKHTYRSPVNSQLQLTDSLRLHAAAIHVHPFATRISLVDKKTNKAIFSSKIVNHKNSTGLTSIEPFSSEEGIWLYKDHNYEIVLDVDNTTQKEQDMMGSMFLFFYDKELDDLLQQDK